MQTTSLIKLFPQTKDEMQNFASQVVNEVLEGGMIDPLELDIRLKTIEETIKLIRKNDSFKSATLEEAEKYDGKTFSYNGYEITKGGKSTYDYKSCKDDELISLEAKVKSRKLVLKSGIDTDTGEVVRKPLVKVTDFIAIKIKQN
jgi:hypothetical protein